MRKQQVLFLIGCIAVGLPSVGFAQKDTERRYRAGVKEVQAGEYDRARADLQVVMQRDGSFAPFAYYYHALASTRQKRFDAARATLKQLVDKYPNWQKREEAYYLAASAAFEQNLVDEAFTYTNLLTEPDLRREADRMEAFFLPRISDLARLKALQKQYPRRQNPGPNTGRAYTADIFRKSGLGTIRSVNQPVWNYIAPCPSPALYGTGNRSRYANVCPSCNGQSASQPAEEQGVLQRWGAVSVSH